VTVGLGLLAAACLAVGGAVEAGHEATFYPSFYPQEIKVETVDAGSAAARLATGEVHAYLGADPFAGRPLPAGVAAVESLGAYLVATLDPAGPLAERPVRCAAARRLLKRLAAAEGDWVFHPYPITPFDADYLEHFDRARTARALALGGKGDGPPLRIRATGELAERLVGSREGSGPGAAVTLEAIGVDELLGSRRVSLGGWMGPPWVKTGWFRAYLLLAPRVGDDRARHAVGAVYRRLVTGDYRSAAEGLDLERTLVARLTAGCERVVVGYTVRREAFSSDYSAGVENVGYDSLGGLDSPIFIRTVKLKDFPWNGWLRLGVAQPASAAWNPVAGFTDATGRLIWAALGDPAFLPAPFSAGWVPNRITSVLEERPEAAPLPVPPDALIPEFGTGALRPVGPGTTAAAKLVYRTLLGAAHDGSQLSLADALSPYVLAFRWADGSDPAVAAATALPREWLAGLRVVKVETLVKNFGEDLQYTYEVPVIEVYLRHTLADPQALASIAPPWSAVPWHVTALLEEAVRRGFGAFSEAEAARRGVAWLDPVRAEALKARLRVLVDEFGRAGYVPAPLARFVSPAEARERWERLGAFAARYGHFLATAGPYRLQEWTPDTVTLEVFRDRAYPLGVGEFDRYPIPRRAWAARVEDRGDRLEVDADVDRVSKFQRSWELVRAPLSRATADEGFTRPVCRYVIVDAGGAVVAAGAAAPRGAGGFTVDLRRLARGRYTVLLALYVGDNAVAPEITLVRHRQPT
jgi:hypothetical protein